MTTGVAGTWLLNRSPLGMERTSGCTRLLARREDHSARTWGVGGLPRGPTRWRGAPTWAHSSLRSHRS